MLTVICYQGDGVPYCTGCNPKVVRANWPIGTRGSFQAGPELSVDRTNLEVVWNDHRCLEPFFESGECLTTPLPFLGSRVQLPDGHEGNRNCLPLNVRSVKVSAFIAASEEVRENVCIKKNGIHVASVLSLPLSINLLKYLVHILFIRPAARKEADVFQRSDPLDRRQFLNGLTREEITRSKR